MPSLLDLSRRIWALRQRHTELEERCNFRSTLSQCEHARIALAMEQLDRESYAIEALLFTRRATTAGDALAQLLVVANAVRSLVEVEYAEGGLEREVAKICRVLNSVILAVAVAAEIDVSSVHWGDGAHVYASDWQPEGQL